MKINIIHSQVFGIYRHTESDLLIMFIFFLIGLSALFVYLFLKKRKNTEQKIYDSLLNNHSLLPHQKKLLESMLNCGKKIVLSKLTKNETYFESIVNYVLELKARQGFKDNELNAFRGEYQKIKHLIKFKKIKHFTSLDIKPGQTVKMKIKDKGYFTGKIIHNDHSGLMIRLPNWEIPGGEFKKNIPILVYYWGEMQSYEIHSKLKKISKKKPQYILVSHDNNMFKGTYKRGIPAKVEMDVFFIHVFMATEGVEIKGSVKKGKIVSISIIGAEISSESSIALNSICDFEFNMPGNKKKYRFTGKVVDISSHGKKHLLFVKFLDMDESCRDIIHSYICRNID